jgi:hypothetical protein
VALRDIDDLFEMLPASTSIQGLLSIGLPARELPVDLWNLSTCTCDGLPDIAAVRALLRHFGRAKYAVPAKLLFN